MADYGKNAATALKLIAKAGKSFVIARPRANFNNVTGIPTSLAPETGNITAVVLPRYKGQLFNSLDDTLKDALVRGKLKTVLAAAKGAPFPPGPLDVITIKGSSWQVVGCTVLAPDGETPIIYTIGVMETSAAPPATDT